MTRILFALYLLPAGQDEWVKTEERLIEGLRASGWLKEARRPYLTEEVCGRLIPLWRRRMVYRLSKKYVDGHKLAAIGDEAQELEVHGRTAVFGLADDYDPEGAAGPVRALDEPELRRAVVEAVEQVRGSITTPPAGAPSAVADQWARWPVCLGVYLEATGESQNVELLAVLNDRLTRAGQKSVSKATICQDLREIRGRLQAALEPRLRAVVADLPTDAAATADDWERSRRVDFDRLIRAAVQGGALVEWVAVPHDRGSPRDADDRRGEWKTAAWPPKSDPRRDRWEKTLAFYQAPPAATPPRPFVPAQTAAERYAVLDDMSAHLEGWLFRRRVLASGVPLADGVTKSFPPDKPVWGVLVRMTGPQWVGVPVADRVRAVAAVLADEAVPFARLPEQLGLTLDDVLTVLRAYRKDARRIQPGGTL